MSPHDFCLWLNGFAELSTEPPTPEQWRAIKEHLQTVFNKVTPPAPGNDVVKRVIDEMRKEEAAEARPIPPLLPPPWRRSEDLGWPSTDPRIIC